jgi:amino-acid N-acetyltransferase
MRPTDLRGILRYVPQFREKTFVVAADGAVVGDENFGNILLDVAVLRSLNVRTVLVHGASAQIQALADEKTSAPSDLEGSGVTDAATLQLALTAANRLTHEILEGLSATDLRAASTNAVIAHPYGIVGGVDHLFTGRVERIDVELLQTLLGNGIVPVVPPLGMDGDGRTWRVNSDAVALEVAKALQAVKLIFITTTDGLVVNGTLARQLSVDELAAALQKDAIAPAQVSKARSAEAAARAGVARVHVINGMVDEGLLAEVFSNEGIGTLVYANDYRRIRPARKRDISSLQQLIRASVESEELLPRSRAAIQKQLDDYFIFEVDRNPVACVALHTYPEQNKGELASLKIDRNRRSQNNVRKALTS